MKVVFTQLHTVGGWGGGGIGSQRYSSTDSKSSMLYCSKTRPGIRHWPSVRGLALAVPRPPTGATLLMLTDPAVRRRPVLRPRGRRRPRRGDSPLADAASVAVSTDGGASRLLRRRWLHGTSWTPGNSGGAGRRHTATGALPIVRAPSAEPVSDVFLRHLVWSSCGGDLSYHETLKHRRPPWMARPPHGRVCHSGRPFPGRGTIGWPAVPRRPRMTVRPAGPCCRPSSGHPVSGGTGMQPSGRTWVGSGCGGEGVRGEPLTHADLSNTSHLLVYYPENPATLLNKNLQA